MKAYNDLRAYLKHKEAINKLRCELVTLHYLWRWTEQYVRHPDLKAEKLAELNTEYTRIQDAIHEHEKAAGMGGAHPLEGAQVYEAIIDPIRPIADPDPDTSKKITTLQNNMQDYETKKGGVPQ